MNINKNNEILKVNNIEQINDNDLINYYIRILNQLWETDNYLYSLRIIEFASYITCGICGHVIGKSVFNNDIPSIVVAGTTISLNIIGQYFIQKKEYEYKTNKKEFNSNKNIVEQEAKNRKLSLELKKEREINYE